MKPIKVEVKLSPRSVAAEKSPTHSVAIRKSRRIESAQIAAAFRKKIAEKIRLVPDSPPRDDFDELCLPFSEHPVAPFVVIDPSVADVPYTPNTSYGEYSGTSCLCAIACAARILASDTTDYDRVLAGVAAIAEMPDARPMFFVSIPIYTIDPVKGDSVCASSLFDELVRYASRAGLFVSAAKRVTFTIGTESIDEYNNRSPLSAERLSIVLTMLEALSADPAVAKRIPDSLAWLFSLFLP
jgi:hypothetical protein